MAAGGISIDTVYQTVLALANKEQRGYISPQEFNLYANHAQMEVLEQYFYDASQFRQMSSDKIQYSDMIDLLEEKIQIFESVYGAVAIDNFVGAGGGGINKRLPDDIYRVHRVELNNVDCELLSTRDFNDFRRSTRMLAPTNDRPIANIRNGVIRVVGDGGNFVTPTGIFYTRVPNRVQWGYVVVNEKALYDANPAKTTDFEHHRSDTVELVYKILKLAGISIKREEVTQVGQGLEIAKVQQEKR